jgi:hypothetical protein
MRFESIYGAPLRVLRIVPAEARKHANRLRNHLREADR